MFCSMISEGTDGVTFLSMMRHKVMLEDRKSTRLNSSHLVISYAVFCLKKKKKTYNKSLHLNSEEKTSELNTPYNHQYLILHQLANHLARVRPIDTLDQVNRSTMLSDSL